MEHPARWAVVTGGNRGIGFEVCRLLGQAGVGVILTARQDADGAEAVRKLEREGLTAIRHPLEVADGESIAGFAAYLRSREPPVQMLVNNAGVALQGFNAEVVRKTMAVNFLGTMRLTEAVLPLMAPQGRIVMVSSGMGELACLSAALQEEFMDSSLTREGLTALVERFQGSVEQGSHMAEGWPASAYNVSKAALNAYTRILARELEGTGTLLNAVCPGWVQTRMGGGSAPLTAAQGADTIAWAALLPPGGHHGAFLRERQPVQW
jgi:NAD(P)-dependent dehydrogenase (short-subunit alcohol dehydrogenase family)